MKHKETETFAEYKERRKAENEAIKEHLKGRKIIFTKKELREIFRGE